MKKLYIFMLFLVLIGGGYIFMAIYDAEGNQLNHVYDAEGNELTYAYDAEGNQIFSADGLLPVPRGNLNASASIPLPDLYETGKGFTCTGLAYDETDDTFLVGDIGILQPNSGTIRSQIVRLSSDFSTVEETIPLYNAFSNMSDVQGVCIDSSDDTIWFCSSNGFIGHVSKTGENLGTISTSRPTGIAYSASDDTLWILNYSNKILHISKTGTVLETYDFAYSEALDQCFLDEGHGYLYITAGANYTGRNNVYLFNINTHEQSIACTVDSYSVEGIVIQSDRMVIVNDGYYHSALVKTNLANIYDLN